MATDVNGVKVYNSFVPEYNKSIKKESELEQLKKSIIDNPDIPKEEKQALIEDLRKAQKSIDAAQATATKEGRVREKGDKNMDLFMSEMGAAQSLMDKVSIEAAEYTAAAKVDPPPAPAPQPGAALSDDVDVASKSADVSTTPPVPASKAFSTAMNGSPADVAAAINNGSLKLSDSDLRALASSGKYEDIMMALNDLPGGDTRVMTMNQRMQESLQKMNRMFTMMGNLNQALHDTQKALINNIRV